MLNGWTVLDRLKHHRDTRHIPVHIISGDDSRQRGLRLGAIAYAEKPLSKDALDDAFTQISEFIETGMRNLLIVEDDAAQRQAIMDLIGEDDVVTIAVGTAARRARPDAIVVVTAAARVIDQVQHSFRPGRQFPQQRRRDHAAAIAPIGQPDHEMTSIGIGPMEERHDQRILNQRDPANRAE